MIQRNKLRAKFEQNNLQTSSNHKCFCLLTAERSSIDVFLFTLSRHLGVQSTRKHFALEPVIIVIRKKTA